MKKPDRYERVVWTKMNRRKGLRPTLAPDDVIQLLRREHAWMRRMVKQELRLTKSVYTSSKNLCKIFLKQLDQRRK